MKKLLILITYITTLLVAKGYCQTTTAPISDKLLQKLNNKYQAAETLFDKQTQKWLNNIKRQEKKLQKQLAKTDSAKAAQVFGDIDAQYQNYTQQLQQQGSSLKQYIPKLDSAHTAAQFLQQQLPNNPHAQALSSQLQNIQSQVQNANWVKQQLKERKDYLKQQLQNTPVAQQLKGMQQQVYYYQQQLNEYKDLLNNPDKLLQRVMQYVRSVPAFANFFNKHSLLGQLFKVPENYGSPQSLAGLQTTASISSMISNRLGVATPTGGGLPSQFTQPLQQASQQLQQLKQKLKNLTNQSSITSSNDIAWNDNPSLGVAGGGSPNAQKNQNLFATLTVWF